MNLLLRRPGPRQDETNGYRLLVGDAEVRSALPVLRGLRGRMGPGCDPITDVDWFLSRTAAWKNSPVAVILQDGHRPAAAGLFSSEQRFGLPTGVVRGGNGSGDGLLVAPAAEIDTLAGAVRALFDVPWVHTVIASLRGGKQPVAVPPALAHLECRWLEREVGTDLSLEGGFEGFLSRQRPRSRRNYRYFRRRAEAELGVSFLPCLDGREAADAVEQLHAVTFHSMPRTRCLAIVAAIRETPGSFAMGLRTPEGRWLSYLAGWRQQGATYIELQLNDHREHAASLSTVMRTFLIEHEAGLGVGRLVFVGGSSAALGRYCAVDGCLDLLVTRRGLRGQMARLLATTLSPHGQVATMMQAPA